MKLSIIIPYYKTLDLTKKLLSKLNKQINNREDIEIILIDDGSNGEELIPCVDIYVKLKNNKGVSGARNIGLKIAKGEYICFIDSDDDITDNYINKIIQQIETKPFDLCWLSWNSPLGQAIVTSTEQPNIAIWGRIFNSNIVKNITFDESYNVHEEFDFWKEIFKNKNLVINFISEIIYNYSIREGSLIRRYNSNEIEERRK